MNSDAPPRLDIIIPVYNEGANILSTLQSILRAVKTPLHVLICYDRDDDDTLPAINNNRAALSSLAISFVRNSGRGAHSAVLSGFAASKAPFAIVFPADAILHIKGPNPLSDIIGLPILTAAALDVAAHAFQDRLRTRDERHSGSPGRSGQWVSCCRGRSRPAR